MKNKQTLTGNIPFERILNFPLYLNNKAYFEEKDINPPRVKIPSASEQLRRLEVFDQLSIDLERAHSSLEFAFTTVHHLQNLYGESNCLVGIFSKDKKELEISELTDGKLSRKTMRWYLPSDQWICCKMEDFSDPQYFISSKNDCCSFIGSFQSEENGLEGIIICEYNTVWLSSDKELQYFSKLLERIGHLWLRFRKRIEREEQISSLIIKNELLEKELKESLAVNQSIRQFTFDLAHDLKAPLRSMGGFATLLKRKYAGVLDDSAKQYVDHILNGVDRFSNSIARLLNFSKANQDELTLELINPNVILDNLLNNLSHILEDRQVAVEWELLPEIVADAIQVEHLFQNLVENAIKFTPKTSAPSIYIIANVLDDGVEFSVKDNGIGIHPEKVKTIFRPFKRLHAVSEFEGSGMGLSICQKIVHRHDGKIWAESEGEGYGTTFKFFIPKHKLSNKS